MTAHPTVRIEVVEAFSRIDCASIGDVLTGLGLRCIPEGIKPLSKGMKVCGPAVTMRHIAARDNRNWARHEKVRMMCNPGDVMVIDMGGRTDGGTWGENGTIDAISRGLNGVVIDGACRDSEAIVELGFPTFVRGTTLRHTHGTFFSTNLNNEPVQIGAAPFAVMVAPGDLVIGEADGLVIVPAERAEEILELATRRHELDVEITEKMKGGKNFDDSEIIKLMSAVRRYQLGESGPDERPADKPGLRDS